MNIATTTGNTQTAPTHEQVAALAYEIWQRGGCKSGNDLQDWLEAESRLCKASVLPRAETRIVDPVPAAVASVPAGKSNHLRRGGNGRIRNGLSRA